MSESSTASTTPDPSGSEVLGSFVDATWQLLETTDDAGDADGKAAATAAEAGLRDELGLILNAETLLVLAGSGTSLGIPAGAANKVAPKMADLWAAVEGEPEFKAVKNSLSAPIVASQNLEHVLSEAQARLALKPDNAKLAAFVTKAEDTVWDRCSFVDCDSDLRGHELFLRKVARRSTRLQRAQIFTTNYDLAFESAARHTRFNVIDGFGYGGGHMFDGGSFDLDFVRRRPNEQLALEPNVFHLLKLHGSVDWTAEDGTIRKVSGKPDNPVLIYPSAAKYQLSYQQPYLEFMSRFQIALRQPDVGLIIAGFGFNDDHLNAPIEAAIRGNIGLRAAIVTPAARKSGRAASIGWVEDLIGRGDRRLTMLAGTFDDLIKYLPDTAQYEERDVHADRVASRRPAGDRQ